MKKNQLRMKIEEAKRRLINAEEAMASALHQMEPATVRDKTMVSNALRTALGEVAVAKTELAELEDLVAPGE